MGLGPLSRSRCNGLIIPSGDWAMMSLQKSNLGGFEELGVISGKRRPARVADAIKKEIATLLLLKIKDPRVLDVTITNVSLTGDLKRARIYYSCQEENSEKVGKGLASAKGYIRSVLAKSLNMRYVPELVFQRDVALLRQEEMEKILQEIKNENESSPESDS